MNLKDSHKKLVLDKDIPISERLGYVISAHADRCGSAGASISVNVWDKAISDIIEVFESEKAELLKSLQADMKDVLKGKISAEEILSDLLNEIK